MQLLKDTLRHHIARKHMSKAMIGTLAVNAVRHHFGYTSTSTLLDGFVSFDKLFLSSTQHHVKIALFADKLVILEKVNQALKNVGYLTNITDLRIK